MSQSQRSGDSSKADLNKEMAALGIHLLCFKHKMKNVVWTKGASGLDGKFQSGSEVSRFASTCCDICKIPAHSYLSYFMFLQLDFYIDNDMIHIADTKVAHRYGDFFIRKVLKFEELNRKLHNIVV